MKVRVLSPETLEVIDGYWEIKCYSVSIVHDNVLSPHQLVSMTEEEIEAVLSSDKTKTITD